MHRFFGHRPFGHLRSGHRLRYRFAAALCLLTGTLLNTTAQAEWDLSGSAAGEWRYFPRDEVDTAQHGDNLSFSVQPEFYRDWDDGSQSLLVIPFARVDQGDGKRTHVDIREFTYLKAFDSWEIRAGINKVFWGVTESQHLVDIINQSDLIENIDTEDKLGQPMINATFIQDWGLVDVFVMPYFRERTFPGRAGRLRSLPRVATDLAEYESSAEEHHVDFAVRYSHALGDFDVGLSHFYGTSREPRLMPRFTGSGQVVLIPYYDIIHQTGLDLQATKGNWLWKLEAIRRQGQGRDTFVALTGGFEYTRVGIFETQMDLGMLIEYLWDERGDPAQVPFQDDVLGGFRLSVNDVQSTAILAGAIIDKDTQAWSLNVEAERRLGDRWKMELEVRFFQNLKRDQVQFSFRDEDYVQFQLSRFF